jgi:hypothetical protein
MVGVIVAQLGHSQCQKGRTIMSDPVTTTQALPPSTTVEEADPKTSVSACGYSDQLQQNYEQISQREQLRIDAEEAERVRQLREKARLD